jgi:hypothetical protein
MRRRNQFTQTIQVRTARIAASASAARGQRTPGLVAAARKYFETLPLRQFGVSRPRLFKKRLDRATLELMRTFPKKGRSWGVARKLLNIFLRDAFYTTYLCDAHHLGSAEHNYELPLDSITARRLRLEASQNAIPRWHGVKHLTPEMSDIFQAAAAAVASLQGIARIHLDASWWGDRS